MKDVPIQKMTGEVYELAEEIALVSRAVRGQGIVSVTGDDGRWSVRMCLKAHESVETGQVVRF